MSKDSFKPSFVLVKVWKRVCSQGKATEYNCGKFKENVNDPRTRSTVSKTTMLLDFLNIPETVWI